jgi:hypothetical protein
LLFSKFSWIQPVYILNECERAEVCSKKSAALLSIQSIQF